MMSGERWEPMQFVTLAEDFYESAICVAQAQQNAKLNLHSKLTAVPQYLFSQAVELALKGFLRAKGISAEDLQKKYSHKFCKLLKDCITYGLPLETTEQKRAMDWLGEYEKDAINFRYPRLGGGAVFTIDIRDIKTNVERVLCVVRPTCEAARDNP
jgi:hypothetical protein